MWNMFVSYLPSWSVLFQAVIAVSILYGLSRIMSKTKQPIDE